MGKLLKAQGWVPRVIITDKLRSYGAEKPEIMPAVEHRSHKGLNSFLTPRCCVQGGKFTVPVSSMAISSFVTILRRAYCMHQILEMIPSLVILHATRPGYNDTGLGLGRG
ncbi:hypothetical protein RvVAT039_pl02410 (plasmid) [Agrobacterium vitis]|nr:hypothetical protein RvVAT039_pl02410 [Agrobacterium vitis]